MKNRILKTMNGSATTVLAILNILIGLVVVTWVVSVGLTRAAYSVLAPGPRPLHHLVAVAVTSAEHVKRER